jgi:hypothetical protein
VHSFEAQWSRVLIPERSVRAKSALDVFFDGYNDVHFYVEDTGQQNAYHAILRRAFPRLRLMQIFPLDGKSNVLQHARDTSGNSVLTKPRVYLVDKDFDDILGRVVSLPGLFYLRKYSIENYLLDEEAVLSFVVESRPKTDREDLRRQLDFPRVHSEMLSDSERLFRLFVVVQSTGLNIPNAALPPERFADARDRSRINPAKVEAYEREVCRALVDAGVISQSSDVEVLCDRAFPCGKRDCHISGKFLLRLLRLRLAGKNWIGNVDADVLFYSLARNFKATAFRELGGRIRKYLRLATVAPPGGASGCPTSR